MAEEPEPSGTTEPRQRKFISQAGVEEVTGEKPLNNYFTTFSHLVKCYVGTGIFAMGMGFKDTGIILGSAFLFILGIMNLNCQYILVNTTVKIAEEATGHVKPTFAEVVQYTMEVCSVKWLRENSKQLGWMTNIFLCLCEVGICAVYFVFIGEHVLEICDNNGLLDRKNPMNMHLVLTLILIPMWASTFLGNLKVLMPVSTSANLLVWAGIGIVYWYTMRGLPPLSQRHMTNNVVGWPIFFGIALFAFEGITFIIPLRNEMKDPRQFVSVFGVLNTAMAFVFMLYFSVGFFAYWKYGDNVRGSVFLNLTEEDPSVADVINVVMSIAVLFSFTLHMYIPFEVTFPLFWRRYGPFRCAFLVVAIYRSIPVLTCYVLANVIPFLGYFISLTGATTGSFLSLMLPPFLELVSQYDDLSKFYVAKDVCILVVGTAGAITGAALSIVQIVDKFMTEYGGNQTESR